MDSFDYIIVGAGSAGCVLANRLSANPTCRVCLIEAGPPDTSPLIHIPFGLLGLIREGRHNWGYNTQPQPALNGRQLYTPRGKTLGGSSSINAMVYIRGHQQDYDDWVAAGNPGWSWQDVLPLFLAHENNELLTDAYFRQEAQHGIVHETYNAKMAAQGVNVEKIIARFKIAIRLFQTHLSPKYQLALTAALEHITATLGEGFIDGEGEMFRHAHPVMRAMFLWHGVEEVEHKAVAFDVYETAAGGGYLTRATALIGGTAVVHVVVGSVAWHMLKVDRMNRRPLLLAKGLYRLYGPRGLLTRLMPRYLDWFRPGFHPMDSGIPKRVEVWLAEYRKHEDPMLASDTVFGNSAQGG